MRDGTRAREGQHTAEGRRGEGGAGHGPSRRPPRSSPPRQVAPARRGPRGRLARALGLGATLLLLGVGVAVAVLVTREGDEPERDSFAAAPTATATAAARAARERRARAGRPQLTNAQRASRDAAVAQLRRQGFEPVAIADYKPRQTLRVLIGRPKASTGVRGRRAFFFVREQYVGTDAAEPSGRLRVVRQSGGHITLAYGLFAPGDKACCPTADTVLVRFAMDEGRLQPLDAIPVAASRMPAS